MIRDAAKQLEETKKEIAHYEQLMAPTASSSSEVPFELSTHQNMHTPTMYGEASGSMSSIPNSCTVPRQSHIIRREQRQDLGLLFDHGVNVQHEFQQQQQFQKNEDEDEEEEPW